MKTASVNRLNQIGVLFESETEFAGHFGGSQIGFPVRKSPGAVRVESDYYSVAVFSSYLPELLGRIVSAVVPRAPANSPSASPFLIIRQPKYNGS